MGRGTHNLTDTAPSPSDYEQTSRIILEHEIRIFNCGIPQGQHRFIINPCASIILFNLCDQ